MKVIILTPWISRGGATNLAAEILRRLQARGIRALPVVAQLKPGQNLPPAWRSLGFSGEYRNPMALRSAAKALEQLIAQEKVQLVHSFLWNADLIGALACAKQRVPHISYILDRRAWLTSRHPSQRIRRALARWLFRRADTRFLAISQSAAEYFSQHLGISFSRVRLARNAVDPKLFIPRKNRSADEATVRLGALSRLVEEKGIEQLLQAMALLKDRNVCLRLDVAGEGPARIDLEALARRLGLATVVKFLGDVPSACAFYETVDIFVVPSIHSEGLPTTILEAMAMGLPVVATDVGGANEAVINGITGCTVQSQSPKALADALQELCTNPQLRASMGIAGRKTIEESFSLDGLVDAHLGAYKDSLSGAW